jgi:hypothetical protein
MAHSGKEIADMRVDAVGYNYESVKIFMPAGRSQPVYAKYIEHMPPDVTACIFWLKNRDPQHWRDSQQMEHVLGKYITSDHPMTEEQWARERADVIDAESRASVMVGSKIIQLMSNHFRRDASHTLPGN